MLKQTKERERESEDLLGCILKYKIISIEGEEEERVSPVSLT